MTATKSDNTARVSYREALILEGIIAELATLRGMAIQMRESAANDDWRAYRDGQAEAFGDAMDVVRRAMTGDRP